MKKNIVIVNIVLITALVVQFADAAVFLDDFSIDTSADYIGTDTHNSGGSFNISNGVLNVSCGDRNTYNVFYKDPLLEVGGNFSVSIPAADNRTDFHNRMTISTTTRGPNTSAEDGIRLKVTGSGFQAQVYRDGAGVNTSYTVADTLNDLTLYIYRDSETEYRVGCDTGSGINILGDIEIPETSGVAAMYVGVEGWANSTTGTFDNLQVIPEPATICLLGMGVMGLIRRRKHA